MKNVKFRVAILGTCLILFALALGGCTPSELKETQKTTPAPQETAPLPQERTPTTPETTSAPEEITPPPLPQMTADSLQLKYEDDFSNSDSGWGESSDKQVSYSYQNGEYNISVSNPGMIYSRWSSSVGEQNNFVVAVDTRVLSSADKSQYGILFRRNENGDFYEFSIIGNSYTVQKRFQGKWSYLKRSTPSSYIKTDGSKNNLRVACLGKTIEVYVNGQRLATLEDDSITSGRISLMASGANTSVNFDNFKLYKFTNTYIAKAAPYLPIITSSSLPDGEVGVSYEGVLTGSGGTPPYLWTLSSGVLPEGLSLSSSSGTITGTPTMEGKYDFVIRLTCSSGEATQDMSIYISELVISTDSLASGIMNVAYHQVLQASGGKPPYTWSIISGNLPQGLVLDPVSGAITGVPAKAGGPFTSVFKVVDSVGASATEGLSLTIRLADFAAIDQHAVNAPKSVETSLPTLVNYLVQPCNTEMEKARVIYRWIAQNIDYDVYTFVSGLYKTPNCPDQSAEAVFTRRNAVCEGYSNLFLKMCQHAGLQAVKISGWSRTDFTEKGNKKDHAWNAVQINSQWQLVDSTWGAGYTEDDKYFVRSFNDFWFLTPPEQFIYTHYPDDVSWQLLTPPVSATTVAQYPVAMPGYFRYGLNFGNYNYGVYNVTNGAGTIYTQAPPDVRIWANIFQNNTKLERSLVFWQRQGSSYQIDVRFPYAGDYELRIYAKWKTESGEYHQALRYKLISNQNIANQAEFPTIFDLFNIKGAYLYSPMTRTLPAGTSQYFQIMVPGAKEVAVILNADSPSPVWKKLSKQGQMFQGSADITRGKIRLSARFGNDNQFWGLLEYKGE